MRNFKIKVTPEQSEVLQKLLFIAGYTWGGGDKKVCLTDQEFLFFSDWSDVKVITFTHSEEYFYNHELPEITFDDFINEIEIELNKSNHNDFLLDMF